jgi:ferredoxin-thioredoxin reductase catalytic subunit
MLKPLDMESNEFKKELEKTKEFTKKVVESKGWAFNADKEIVDTVILGLTRNKILYGKRFCPCFMVEQTEDGKYKSADDRICPCKPAINDEIPNQGMCHCGIFIKKEKNEQY